MKRFQQATLPHSMSRINHSHKPFNKVVKKFLHSVLFFSSGGRETRRRAKSDRKKREKPCSKHLQLDNLLAS